MNENILKVSYYNRYDLSKCGLYKFKVCKNIEIRDIWKSYAENGYVDNGKLKPISFIEYLYYEEKLLKEEVKIMNSIENKIEVAGYCRTALENEEEIQKQEKALLKYCKEKGYKIHKIYKDNGFSGNNIERPSFNLMIEDLKKGYFNKIVALKLDRITRNIMLLTKLNEDVKEYNCDYEFVLGNIDTSAPAGKMFIHMIDTLAQMEKETLKEERKFKKKQIKNSKNICRK